MAGANILRIGSVDFTLSPLSFHEISELELMKVGETADERIHAAVRMIEMSLSRRHPGLTAATLREVLDITTLLAAVDSIKKITVARFEKIEAAAERDTTGSSIN